MTSTERNAKPVYVETLYWRFSDPFLTVVGFDRSAVIEQARKLASDELENAVEQEYMSADETIDEDSTRDNLASDLCSTDCSEYSYADAVRDFLDAEHIAELDRDGLTIL
jgi:hypothetical protein